MLDYLIYQLVNDKNKTKQNKTKQNKTKIHNIMIYVFLCNGIFIFIESL